MSTIEPEVQEKLMNILKSEENSTDLDNLAILSRVGMKVASSQSAELDADATSASSTALIDLGLRLSEATYHGALKEIILHNQSGYIILTAINDEYIVFGGLKNALRIGFYLGYIREMAKKLNALISGGEITEMALSMEKSELEQFQEPKAEPKEPEELKPVKPSVTQDMEALDGLLGFLDEWEQEDLDLEDLDTGAEGNVVSIPKSMTVGIPESGSSVGLPDEGEFDFDEELELDTEIGLPSSTPSTPKAATESDFKVYDDEVAPIPLDDVAAIDVEDEDIHRIEAEETVEEVEEFEELEEFEPAPKAERVSKPEYIYESEEEEATEELHPLDELPSFDELNPPDFGSSSEYDVDFVLEEEGAEMDKVLKDLGWEEDEE
ncbi:MAG: hypothetical protein EU548_09775 [Promethearchaeota archaeon]|nr:MAG: hypothetical protein EU548_09775 [Candidatus Lokiarchaeota archaeon]